jgi:hypothetical protein
VGAIVEAASAAQVYCFAAGIHERVSILPRSGDIYLGVADAVLDGGGVTLSAFRSVIAPNMPAPIRDVTIRGLTIQNYTDEPTYRSQVSPRAALEGGEGWLIENNVIQDNMLGIGLGNANWGWGDGAVIRNNRILNNSYMGIESNGSDIVFEHNELAGNGWALTDEERGWSGGGSKFTDQGVFADMTFSQASMIVRERRADERLMIHGNWVHSNVGNGIWLDINNHHAQISANVIENNYGSGVFDELSSGTRIQGNIIRWNRLGNLATGYWGGAEILVANSQAGEVFGNDVTISGTSRGVVLIYEQARSEFPTRDYVVRDNTFRYEIAPTYVYRNLQDIVTGGEILAGVTGAWGDPGIYQWGNQFLRNTYHLPMGGLEYFYWGERLTWMGFQRRGLEMGGVCRVASGTDDC